MKEFILLDDRSMTLLINNIAMTSRGKRTAMVVTFSMVMIIAVAVISFKDKIWYLWTTGNVNALVQAVKLDDGLVVLSVGENERIGKGDFFTVFRDNRVVGKVEIIEVYPDLSAARICSTSDAIRVGDKATARVSLTLIRERADKLQEIEIFGCSWPYADPLPPPIDAIVRSIDVQRGVVTISAGWKDSVKTGYKFTLYRGSTFAGKIQIIKVLGDHSLGKILYTANDRPDSLRVGDCAATQL